MEAIVKYWAKLSSITQDRYTEKKSYEFINLVKDSGNFKSISKTSDSSNSNNSKLEKLADLKEKGVITEKELLSDI